MTHAARRYVPAQHGAWAFLGLPVLLAIVVTPWTWLIPVLAVAWVVAYPWSYAALSLARARRPGRYRRPLAVWSAVLVPLAILLVAARPWLVWVGAAYLALFAVNMRFARRNDERALVNDGVFVVECSSMVVVTWAVAVGERSLTPPPAASVPIHVWVLTAVCALVLSGSTVHVKSLLRERRDPRYAAASRRFALVSVAVAVGLGWWWGLPSGLWLVVPFVALAVRAFVVGRGSMRPGQIGMVELAGFVLVVACAGLAAAGG